MQEPLAELPDEVCFELTEAGELLNLLYWLQELLDAAENDSGVARVNGFIRVTQRRLWGDVQDIIDDGDQEEEK